MLRLAVRLGESRKTGGSHGLQGTPSVARIHSLEVCVYVCVCVWHSTAFHYLVHIYEYPKLPLSPPALCFSQYQINASETHSTIGLYSGWDYTDFMALAHVPIRPPNDFYPLGDILSNGQALDGSHINILAVVKSVSLKVQCMVSSSFFHTLTSVWRFRYKCVDQRFISH